MLHCFNLHLAESAGWIPTKQAHYSQMFSYRSMSSEDCDCRVARIIIDVVPFSVLSVPFIVPFFSGISKCDNSSIVPYSSSCHTLPVLGKWQYFADMRQCFTYDPITDSYPGQASRPLTDTSCTLCGEARVHLLSRVGQKWWCFFVA